jgi:hypothetical protein
VKKRQMSSSPTIPPPPALLRPYKRQQLQRTPCGPRLADPPCLSLPPIFTTCSWKFHLEVGPKRTRRHPHQFFSGDVFPSREECPGLLFSLFTFTWMFCFHPRYFSVLLSSDFVFPTVAAADTRRGRGGGAF